MRDMGMNPEIKLRVDATAAIGMLMKDGLSGVRHIDTQYLWLQEAIKSKEVDLKKIEGKLNIADAFLRKRLVVRKSSSTCGMLVSGGENLSWRSEA